MSGFKKNLFNKEIAGTILEDIISKVLECCELMVKDLENSNKEIKNKEEDIRDYLFINYLENEQVRREVDIEKYRFFPEALENFVDNKPEGRADLKVYDEQWFNFPQMYFLIECKRVDGYKTMNRKYLGDGVHRFVGETPPQYSSNLQKNCMLGFVVKNIDIASNVEKINQLQNDEYPSLQVNNEIKFIHIDTKFKHTYISSYMVNKKDLELYHVFYDFSKLPFSK